MTLSRRFCQFPGERRETGLAVSAPHPEAALGLMVLGSLGLPEALPAPHCSLGGTKGLWASDQVSV